ncbi:MAG: DUF1902 domain-containing protein [Rhodospirillales bacterium]|nr:DUF1902 domain-containing protein [Rhodospirillales bacterium]
MANSYSVDVFRCTESDVLVATSEDIPGLTLEADTLGGMLEAVMEMVPELLERNLDVPRDAEVQVTVRLQQPEQPALQQGRSRRPRSQVSALTPRYVVEETLIPSHA